MRTLNWLWRGLLFFILFAFALNNQHVVELKWFLGYSWQAPMVFVVLGAVGPSKVLGRAEYDNARPRDAAFLTTGFRQRSLWAHQNSYEALPFFFAAVIVAEMRGVPQGTINALAVAYLLARVGYVVCYWADRPTARSLVWAVAFFLNIAIFVSPVWAR